MTSAGPVEGEHTAWDGESSAVQDLRDLLVPLAPEGALRIVLQRLALHESSRPVGEHEVLDVVADVEGNLVSVPLRGRVREDPPLARALDETDRKSTRLNSSHVATSYAVFRLNKKTGAAMRMTALR